MSDLKIAEIVTALQNRLAPVNREFYDGLPRTIKRIKCTDGFSMSVQAGEYAYCTPRNNYGPWVRVEVGFPSSTEESLMPYAEDDSNPTGTFYSYVPIELVASVIHAHGGFSYE